MTNRQPSKSQNKWSRHKFLRFSAFSWFLVAVIGQGIFAYYIAAYYVFPALSNGIEFWTNTTLPKSYIPNDFAGNFAIASHLFLAAVITLGGPLQLIPYIRYRFRRFHRWNGRLYMLTALIMSLSGLYLVIFRGAVGGSIQHISLSVNAVLILVFATFAIKHAINNRIAIHQRWALRLFIAVSGVWFARAGLWLSMFVNGGPYGFDPQTFEGPFLDFLGFAQYLIPLALLELYFYASKSQNRTILVGSGCIILLFTLLMGAGIYAASVGMWLPRIAMFGIQ